MNWTTLETWARQPTTIHGLGVVVAAAAAAVAHVFSGNPEIVAVAGGVGYVLTQFGINDNSASVVVLEHLFEDGASLAQGHGNVATVAADVAAVVADVAPAKGA